MKCEFNLSGGQTLVISAAPFNEPSHSETGEEKPVIISLTLCQNKNKNYCLTDTLVKLTDLSHSFRTV